MDAIVDLFLFELKAMLGLTESLLEIFTDASTSNPNL